MAATAAWGWVEAMDARFFRQAVHSRTLESACTCIGWDILLGANELLNPDMASPHKSLSPACVSKRYSGPGKVIFLCNQPCLCCVGMIAKVWANGGELVPPLSKVTDRTHSWCVVRIPYLLCVSINLSDEGYGDKGIHGHFPCIPLSGALLQAKYISINIEVCEGSIWIDKDRRA